MTSELALQFAMMLSSGMPSIEAATYFLSAELVADRAALSIAHDQIMRSPEVKAALKKVQGKAWQEMTSDERYRYAVEKNLTEAAYFLYSHNYALLQGAERQKADTCRQVLEAKLAGTSGTVSPLEQWMKDVAAGRVVLPAVRPA